MNRLPIFFEKKVLNPAGIIWDNKESYITDYLSVLIDKYEIAGRAIEHLDTYSLDKHGKTEWRYWLSHEKFVSDEDFCGCVFKAIDKLWE